MRRNFSQSACLVPNLFFEKMDVPPAPWTWVCSRQPAPGTGVKHLLPPLRPAWGSVWLGMKCSEARCDCIAKARPPGSRLSSTKTQHTPTSTSSLALCCGFCFFFLGCANAHPHARVFAHALTPVLTVLPPWLFQRSKSHAHDLFPMTMPCPSYWRSCPYPPPHTHLL